MKKLLFQLFKEINIQNLDIKLEDNNICFLNGNINEDSADYIIRFILEKNSLPKDDQPDNIKIIINSDGGSLTESFAIVDIMNTTNIPIWTYGIGEVCSGGIILLMSGDKGNRYIFDNTILMTHQFSASMEGKEHELKSKEKLNRLYTNKIFKLYEKRTGMTKNIINKKLLGPTDFYMDADEAIKYGFADFIVSNLNIETEAEETVNVILES